MKIIVVFYLSVISLISFSQVPGTLDSSFGKNGNVLINHIFGNLPANAVITLPDGRIIASCSTRDFALVCLLPDGTPDRSFGSGGFI